MPVLCFLGICLWEVLAILYLNSGRFLYTLDDPYIHLRVAENIAQGHYGINHSEYSSPSSSILWPFLLVPFSHLKIAEYIPLVLNILSSLGTLALFAFISRQVVESHRWVGYITTILMLGTNLIGLTFTGLEHSLQVCLTMIVVAGLIVDTREGTPPWWLLLAIMAGPLVRYEGLLISGATILYFLCRRYYKIAFWCSVIPLILLGGFSWFLLSLGLEGLPNSVIIKMLTHTDGGTWTAGIFKAGLNLLTRQGAILVAGLLLLSPILFQPERPLSERLLAGWTAIVASGHLLTAPAAGEKSVFLHFDRYDIYAVSTVLVVLLFFYRDYVNRIIRTQSPIWIGCQSMVLLVFVSQPYLMASIFTPVASNNIYEQQYQMRKFIHGHYRKPIAVNDLGLTSYRNPNYVLDLWGLGSLETLNARIWARSEAWMDRLTKSHDIQAAIIYDKWFPKVPKNWIRVATLHLSKYKLAPADTYVSFYVLDTKAMGPVCSALASFRKDLPHKVRLDLETSTDFIQANPQEGFDGIYTCHTPSHPKEHEMPWSPTSPEVIEELTNGTLEHAKAS